MTFYVLWVFFAAQCMDGYCYIYWLSRLNEYMLLNTVVSIVDNIIFKRCGCQLL